MDDAQERAQALAERRGKFASLLQRRAQELLGSAVGQDDPTFGIQCDHRGRDVGEHRGGAPAGALQCGLAGADVGGHPVKGAEYLLELHRWGGHCRRREALPYGERQIGRGRQPDGISARAASCAPSTAAPNPASVASRRMKVSSR